MKRTPAAATAWQVELTVLMCLELVVMDLCVMWIPRKHVFSVKSKMRIAMVILVYAVLVIIAIWDSTKEVFASPAYLLVIPVVLLMNAVMMLFVKLFLGQGGFVYLNRTGLGLGRPELGLDLPWTGPGPAGMDLDLDLSLTIV